MKFALMITMALVAAFAVNAKADTYPVLATYNTLATELITLSQAAKSPDDITVLEQKTRDLINVGTEILKLYGEKNPNCSAQFTAFVDALPTMENKSLQEVKTVYHDGKGLPVAPRHCYMGRSEIVHPVMNLIRMKTGWSEEVRSEVVDDFQEVVEHLARIQKNLDTPPN